MSNESALSTVCEGLIFRIFQPPSEQGGVVVALASPHRRAGVSQIAKGLANSLQKLGETMVVSISFGAFKGGSGWFSGQTGPAHFLQEIRRDYRYAFLDCGSLSDSQDIIRIAPLVDGVLLVVEANRTRKDQISYAERTLEAVNGRILGHVLNKRKYVIPNWLHTKMAGSGV